MKKIITIIAVVSVMLIPFSGCRKLVDHIFRDDTTTAGNCRIAKIIRADEVWGEVSTGIVYYNDHNDPDSVIFDFDGSTAQRALYYFFYDDDHRLIEYRVDYSREPGDYFSWHKYGYENGVIATDTARIRQAGQWGEVRNIQYDLSGRVIKENRRIIELDYYPADEEANPFEYAYDASGNLDGEIYVYDKKVNFLRTNKVWMFIQRNYSMNNRPGATSYNEYGLPLTFEIGRTPRFLVEVTSLEYQCSSK